MAHILSGLEVAKQLQEQTITLVNQLKQQQIQPTLAILRVGEKADDLSYEKSTIKRCQQYGIEVKTLSLASDVAYDTFYQVLSQLNADPSIHGILMLRPLPSYLDNEKARNMIHPDKDVDGCTDASLAAIFTNTNHGFAPCTAQAAMDLLDYYKIPLSGKHVVVIGRSLVVGRPLSMLLLHRNATVTICHSKTANLSQITQNADIVISCCGQMEFLNANYVSQGQTIIDVGIHYNSLKGHLCGDVLFEEVEPIVAHITPVPKGVGSITTALLLQHVALAASKQES